MLHRVRIRVRERRIRRRLEIHVRLRPILARPDRLHRQPRRKLQSRLQEVAHAEIDLLGKQVVLEDDEACVERRRVAQDVVEGLHGLGGGYYAAGDFPVVGVELVALFGARPDDGDEAH